MTTIEIELGEYHGTTKHFDPGVSITIDGDRELAKEVSDYLEKFESSNTLIGVG